MCRIDSRALVLAGIIRNALFQGLEHIQTMPDDFQGQEPCAVALLHSLEDRQPLGLSEWQTATTCLNPKNAT